MTATNHLHHLIHTEQININLVLREIGIDKNTLFEKLEANQFNSEEMVKIRKIIKDWEEFQ